MAETQAGAGVWAEGGGVAAPTLPKGGGAIRGMGEKFGTNPVTGTGSLAVPIFTTPGRAGFFPKLSLSYDSGAGNGSFGFGWHLSVPAITRKTDKGLPRYQDDDQPDTFVLSEAEDLVPALKFNGADWIEDSYEASLNGTAYKVRRYRPRIEGLFVRTEWWRNRVTGESFWKSISKDNITSFYGSSGGSRIADPNDPGRVFSWLLALSYDDRGNVIVYDYKSEDQTNVTASLHEQNREVTASRYLKQIRYGNRTPYYPANATSLPTDFCFDLVFDYGEHNLARPRIEEDTFWRCRPDPFSSYRAGFEVRTYRLCSRVLMFHSFAELGAQPCLVRSTDFAYSFEQEPSDPLNRIYSFICSVTQKGYIRQADGVSYETREFPPLEFDYTKVEVDETIHFVDAASLENLPSGADGARYEWIDLDSEGSPGILTEQGDGWFYKRNISNLPRDGNGVRACFEAEELVATKPSLVATRGGKQQFMDLSGEGELCLVQFAKPVSGYYERDEEGEWQPFTAFESSPEIDWSNPNLRSVDLDGDGYPDLLITEDEVLTWYPSRAKEGFGSPERIRKPFDENDGPALVFADGTQSIYLADLSGDGLTDLVRVRNGEVCYWPNLGYGRFGARITMDDAPFFDQPDSFDQNRVRLADIDGSGTTDIIYLGRNKVTYWFNQSGNGWSSPHELAQFPATDELESVGAIDLLGNGTACLVWSSPLPGDARRPMSYIDLMGGQKPHLLVGVKNNLGAETRVQYAASTKFYLQDRAAGTPWITKLPFPVHAVEMVESYDYVSKTKLVSLYQYHHGYHDGIEREFRGFGMVEQIDTESYSKFSGIGLFTETPEADSEEFHLPPVRTKTWFHNGAYVDQDNISQHFAEEYYQGDAAATLLPDTVLPDGLRAQETQEAARALKGRILRQEVYADDNSDQSGDPYTATEHTYRVRLVQPMSGNPHAVFYAYEEESLGYHYERKPEDPRVSHDLTLEVDDFGTVTKFAVVGYPRRIPLFPEQSKAMVTYTEKDVINRASEESWYRLGLPVEARTYELTMAAAGSATEPYRADDLLAAATAALEIPYETEPTPGTTQKRLIERIRTLYRSNTLGSPLTLGQAESLGLPWQSYKLAFTPGLLQEVYASKIGGTALTALLNTEGGYQDLDGDGHWWIASGRAFFSSDPAHPDPAFARQHFYLGQGFQDPFGNSSHVSYDPYDLLVVGSEDAVGNVISERNDYRVMVPWMVIDPNANRAAVRFDALGFVIATAIMGKEGANEGDTLDDPTTRLEYDLFNWKNNQQPVFVHTFAREQHGLANPRWQESYSYSDGVGREVMHKVQAEPGLAPARDAGGGLLHDSSGALIFEDTNTRWVGTGRTVFDNKGNPIKQYEPFFDCSPDYGDETELVEWGVTPLLRYDPLGRLIRTDLPNGSFSEVEFDSWQQITSDQNDTVLESEWYAERGSPDPAGPEPVDAETRAAWLAAQHAHTPTVAYFDILSRPFLTIADNGPAGRYETRVELDIEGNQRAITDARQRRIMSYDYDMLGTRIHSASVDAGERWMLNEAMGNSLRGWDSRDHQLFHEYDLLRRPTNFLIQTGSAAKRLAERRVYGEGQPYDQELNLRGKGFQLFDGAGVITNSALDPETGEVEAYDFKGNLLRSTRQLLQNYKDEVDWLLDPPLEAEVFATGTTYDALNRPVTLTTPDKSVIRPTYNEANLLEQVSANLRGAAAPTTYVTNIYYNAKAQRELIEFGNGVRTDYSYDEDTFRLTHLKTTRPNFPTDQEDVQDLAYTYDPIGNITEVTDAAQETIYFNNQVVPAKAKYVYDAIYRLTDATGREHIGQVADPQPEYDYNDFPRVNLPHPNDGNAMRGYAEHYEYDEVGNTLRMIHQAANGNWTRRYAYDLNNNRLLRTSLPGDPESGPYSARYGYDPHGSMAQMPHLPLMQWNFKDQLQATAQQVVNTGSPEITYYSYNAAGERVCKVTERANGTRKQGRIYLGGFEIYREYSGDGSAVTLERETLHAMDKGRRIALVETKTIDTSNVASTAPASLTRYQCDNHLGSACLELDDSGSVISFEEYYPFGSTSYQAGRDAAEVSLKRYRYIGKERDTETGLCYYGARYYAPWLGRWISYDPAGMVDGPNLYGYARDNPISRVDPDGMQSGAEGGPPSYPVARSAGLADVPDRAMASLIEQAKRDLAEAEERAKPIAPPAPIAQKPKLRGPTIRSVATKGAQVHPPDPRTAMYETAAADPIAAAFIGLGSLVEATLGKVFGFELDPEKAAAGGRFASQAASMGMLNTPAATPDIENKLPQRPTASGAELAPLEGEAHRPEPPPAKPPRPPQAPRPKVYKNPPGQGQVSAKNPIVGKPRKGSGELYDPVKPKGKQEFPAGHPAHGFPDIVDLFADNPNSFYLGSGVWLYQVEGSQNGVSGRFEWTVQDGSVTHRMFVAGGGITGQPIRK